MSSLSVTFMLISDSKNKEIHSLKGCVVHNLIGNFGRIHKVTDKEIQQYI